MKIKEQRRINSHPILQTPKIEPLSFYFNGIKMTGKKGEMITSALIANHINIFGKHIKDKSPQGIFCANGQCAQCTVILNGKPVKGCVTALEEEAIIERCNTIPELPAHDKVLNARDPLKVETQVLIIGGGPSGLSAALKLGEHNISTLLVDDKGHLGGKLVLQTHKFFGSQNDVYAGERGINIAKILENKVKMLPSVEIWNNSSAVAVFSDEFVGILKNGNEYTLVKPDYLLIATGAREKMLIFSGNTLPGVYGAGAFQILVNRDLIKSADRIFIVGGGNIGLIAGYHAIQAGIEVVGLVEALSECSGYKVHEDKLKRLGVPIYTSHTIISADGVNQVESITIGELDKNWNVISGTERAYSCDSILIAVGLNPVDEFYSKAKDFGFKVCVCGDAQEIAEASSAIFTGRIEAIKILKTIGIVINDNLKDLEKKANLLKSKPAMPLQIIKQVSERDIFPLFHCTQLIPCNPCTAVCPQDQIFTIDNLITQIPYFQGEKECIGCGRCVSVCPGLAITLLDYRKDKENPLVTFPYELISQNMIKEQFVRIVSNQGDLGYHKIVKTRIIKEFPRTLLITVKLPKEIAQKAVGIGFNKKIARDPIEIYNKKFVEDDIIVCRCERVSAGEIRNWIKQGITDINELKALTKIGMGACGGKTCFPLILSIFRQEGISIENITKGSVRPLFMEVPMKYFVRKKEEL